MCLISGCRPYLVDHLGQPCPKFCSAFYLQLNEAAVAAEMISFAYFYGLCALCSSQWKSSGSDLVQGGGLGVIGVGGVGENVFIRVSHQVICCCQLTNSDKVLLLLPSKASFPAKSVITPTRRRLPVTMVGRFRW